MKNRQGELSRFELAAYGLGGIFINFGILCDQYSMYFLTNVALLPAEIVGTLLMLTTIFDAVNDPIIGNMADHCDTRLGRYRPFIIAGGLLMCVTMTLRFSVPPLGTAGKVGYYGVVFALFSMAFTMCCVPWQASISILTGDYHERNLLLTMRSLSGALVNAAIGVTVLRSVALLGGDRTGWRNYVLLLWLLGLPCVYLCQKGLWRIDHPGAYPPPVRRPFVTQFFGMLRNKPVMCLGGAVMLASLAQSMAGNCAMYYYQYILEDTSVLQATSIYSMPISVAAALCTPLILRRIPKWWLMVWAYVISMIRPVVLVVFGARVSIPAATALVVISRIGTVLINTAVLAWIPECVDWTNWKAGAASAGLVNASITFLQKFGRSLGQWLAGLLMGIAGFHVTEAMTPKILRQILNINGLYQGIFLTLAMVPVVFFPISHKKAAEIREALAQRDGKKDAGQS